MDILKCDCGNAPTFITISTVSLLYPILKEKVVGYKLEARFDCCHVTRSAETDIIPIISGISKFDEERAVYVGGDGNYEYRNNEAVRQ